MQRLFIPSHKNNHRPHLLRSKALAIYSILLIVFQLSLNFFWASQNSEALAASSITAQEVFDLTNIERAELGLSQLTMNNKLATAAYNKGLDMFADQYWAHYAPDGTSPWDFILQAGYDYHYAGENLAKDFTKASSVVSAWMNSPSHRENIVNTTFEEMGIAVVSGIFEGENTSIVVQMFGTQMETITAPIPTPTQETQLTPVTTTTPTPTTPINTPTTTDTPKQVPAPEIKDTTPPQPPIITSPKNSSIINNDLPVILGTIEESATIHLYDAQNKLGSVPSEGTNFSYKIERALSEGDHLLSATATDEHGNTSDFSDIVTILVDTYPPFIDENSVELESFYRFSQKALRIRVIILADPKQVTASIGEYSLILQKDANNLYSGILAPENELLTVYNKVSIKTNDEAGNSAEIILDIPEFTSETEKDTSSQSILGAIIEKAPPIVTAFFPSNNQDKERIFYSLFGMGLMGLMILNSAILEKKKIEIEGGNTLTHACMLGISLMGVIWGNLGVITSGASIIK